MKGYNSYKVAILDTSAIVRAGVGSLLKHLPDGDFYPIEIASSEAFGNFVSLHAPDVIIVNPSFEGWFNIAKYKVECPDAKFVALIYSLIDPNLIREYDETISICDDEDTIYRKLNGLFCEPDDGSGGQESLSQREREIIICVVKGLTNKEIADKLCLSIHTVITHRRNIAKKLQIHSPAGLTIYAIVNKLVDVHDVKSL